MKARNCCNLSGGVALIVWFTTNGMCAKNKNICMWREQAIIEWSRRVISFVACCHGAKLCAHAARDFRSQQNQPQIFDRKSISRNTTHRQSYHLQAMLTGVKRWKASTRSEKVNNLKTAIKKPRRPNREVELNSNMCLTKAQTDCYCNG